MNETPARTPKSDAIKARYKEWRHIDWLEEYEELELELTAAREELKTVTEQRDRMAHLVQRCETWFSTMPQGFQMQTACNEALQSLNQNPKDQERTASPASEC